MVLLTPLTSHILNLVPRNTTRFGRGALAGGKSYIGYGSSLMIIRMRFAIYSRTNRESSFVSEEEKCDLLRLAYL
jgi:hypothetical protein